MDYNVTGIWWSVVEPVVLFTGVCVVVFLSLSLLLKLFYQPQDAPESDENNQA